MKEEGQVVYTADNQRFRSLLKELKNLGKVLNDSDFATKTGVNRSYVSELRNDKRVLTTNYIEQIYNTFPEINRVWLLTGEGSMLTEERNSGVQGKHLDEDEYAALREKGLPLIPEYAEAFRGGNAGNPIFYDYVASYWSLPDVKADMIIPVEGDSMSPTYPAGSKLAVRRMSFSPDEPFSIPFGEAFAFIAQKDGDAAVSYVKRLRRHSDPMRAKQYWIAHSDNPNYDDFEVEITTIQSLWRVAASITIGS